MKILFVFLLSCNFVFAQFWGSVYMDSNTGIAGGASNAKTNSIANKAAEQSCIDKHRKKRIPHKCEYLTSFSQACVAAYWSPDNKKIGWSYGIDFNNSKKRAYNMCINAQGKKCQLSLGFCTDRIMY